MVDNPTRTMMEVLVHCDSEFTWCSVLSTVSMATNSLQLTSRAASILISVCSLTCNCSPISCDVCFDEFNVFTNCSSSSNDPWAVCNNLRMIKVNYT